MSLHYQQSFFLFMKINSYFSIHRCFRRSLRLSFTFILLLVLIIIPSVFETSAQEQPPEQLLTIPGTKQGIGTHFEITDSAWLNVSLDSSAEINVQIESIPNMISINTHLSVGITSTVFELTGLESSTQYHMYIDNYHNHVAFITDVNGKYTWQQDISTPHSIFIQTFPSTKFINTSGGDCSSIGIWNPNSLTCTLTRNVDQTIQIESSGITLDGNGFLLSGTTHTGNGVYVVGSSSLPLVDVTVKNIHVKNFVNGIYLNNVNNTQISNIVGEHNNKDLALIYSNNNQITDSTFFWNGEITRDIITQIFPTGVDYGYLSQNNTATGNTFYNLLVPVTAGSFSYTNIFYRNNVTDCLYPFFSNNDDQQIIYNLPLPEGGNYWDTYDELTEGCADLNSDYICDENYVFQGHVELKDQFPWTAPNAWKTLPTPTPTETPSPTPTATPTPIPTPLETPTPTPIPPTITFPDDPAYSDGSSPADLT